MACIQRCATRQIGRGYIWCWTNTPEDAARCLAGIASALSGRKSLCSTGEHRGTADTRERGGLMSQIEVIVGGMHGSEAKGHITAWRAKQAAEARRPLIAVRVAGPNAGHT